MKREEIYALINQKSKYSKYYDWFMLVMIIISIGPLMYKEDFLIFDIFDKIAVTTFIVDYLLRWCTADLRYLNRTRWRAFLIYPITPLAIIDLLSILPSFSLCNKAFKIFRVTRLLKILRVFKFMRYSKHFQILFRVLYREQKILWTVFVIAIGYIFVTALIMFNVEETNMFHDFFDALYWATTTLTTVGYGDIYPLSDVGRFISMLSSIFGVAIIALPSGVITASYLEELREQKKNQNNQ